MNLTADEKCSEQTFSQQMSSVFKESDVFCDNVAAVWRRDHKMALLDYTFALYVRKLNKNIYSQPDSRGTISDM